MTDIAQDTEESILPEGKTMLLVDDDLPWLTRLARAMERRGYIVSIADNVAEGLVLAKSVKPAYAVVDMRLQDGNGMDVIEAVQQANPDGRVIMLTGYGNITTAVEAVKKGAVDYLAKPADADEIEAALTVNGASKPKPPENPMSADRVRWEHIQRVYELCDRNVSETALIQEAIDEAGGHEKQILVTIGPEDISEPYVIRQPEIIYGLGNLIENAAEFSTNAVAVTARIEAQSIEICVSDDGPGFAYDILPRLGEPWLTSRPASGDMTAQRLVSMSRDCKSSANSLSTSGLDCNSLAIRPIVPSGVPS